MGPLPSSLQQFISPAALPGATLPPEGAAYTQVLYHGTSAERKLPPADESCAPRAPSRARRPCGVEAIIFSHYSISIAVASSLIRKVTQGSRGGRVAA